MMARLSAKRARAIGLAGLLFTPTPLFVGGAVAAEVVAPMPTKLPMKARAKAAAPASGNCTNVLFPDESADDDPTKRRGARFDLAGACGRVTGSIDNTFQNDLYVKLTDGTSNNPNTINTVTAKASLDTSRATPLGTLRTNTMVQWQKATNDDTERGTATVQSLYGSLAGLTVGYTNSLMDFWGGDFQFLATTSNESVGIVAYEHAIMNNVKLAIAAESGLPSASQSSEGLKGITTTSPDATGRVRYSDDSGLTLHLSGLVRQADFPAIGRRAAFSQTGWAVAAGVGAPFRLTGEKDTISAQIDYAINAVQVLGTAADIQQTEQYGVVGPTRGWDIVASINHPWTDTIESNAFVSYVAVEVDAPGAKPTARSTRLAANIYWRPMERLRLGAEIGWVHAEINSDGITGLPFSKLDGVAGYLTGRVEF